MTIKLALAVQYATPFDLVPRWRARRWVQHAVTAIEHDNRPDILAFALTLRFVDTDEGRRLNHDFRQRDYATNVLTFEYGIDPQGTLSSDIVICVPVVQREAREQDKLLLNHAAHLTIHGVLHAAGYDHIKAAQAQAMEAMEIKILQKTGIGNPYQA